MKFCIFQLRLIVVSQIIIVRCTVAQGSLQVATQDFDARTRCTSHYFKLSWFHVTRLNIRKPRINWELLLITDLNLQRITRNWNNGHFYSAQVFIIDFNIIKFETFYKWNSYKFDGTKIGVLTARSNRESKEQILACSRLKIVWNKNVSALKYFQWSSKFSSSSRLYRATSILTISDNDLQHRDVSHYTFNSTKWEKVLIRGVWILNKKMDKTKD